MHKGIYLKTKNKFNWLRFVLLLILLSVSGLYFWIKNPSIFSPSSNSCIPRGGLDINHTNLQQAIEKLEKCGSTLDAQSDQKELAEVEYNIGVGWFYLFNHREAIPHLQKALSLDKSATYNRQANIMKMSGLSHSAIGAFDKSLEYFEKEIELRVLDQDKAGKIHSLYNKSRVCIYLNRYRDSERALDAASEILEMIDNTLEEGWVQLGYGRLYSYLNRPEKAEQHLRAAKDKCWREGKVVHPILLAQVNFNLGGLNHDRSLYSSELDNLDDAEQIAVEHRELTNLLSRIKVDRGRAHKNQGKHDKALELLQKALPELQKQQDIRYEILTHAALAHTYWLKNDLDKVIEPSKAAYELAVKQQDQLMRAQMSYTLALYLMELGQLESAETHFSEAADSFEKARNDLPDFDSRRRIMGSLPMIYANWAALRVYQNRLQGAFEVLERGRAKSLIDLFEGARNSRSTRIAENDLSQKIRADVSSVKYHELTSFLPENVTLIEYFHPGNIKIDRKTQEDLWIFLITKESIQLVRVPVSEAYLTKILFEHFKAFRVPQLEIPWSSILLARYFLHPVVNKVRTRNLIIVPWKGTFVLPLTALWNSAIPTINVSIAPSALAMKYIFENQKSEHNIAMIFANPATDVGVLEAAETEGSRLRRYFAKSELLVGRNATESAVKQLKAVPDILHFASHGFFDVRDPFKSSLKLAADLSNDGNLELAEVYDLNLKGVSLVSLGACETGMAQVYYGEELHGLVQGFLLAGAPSVVATLWPVDDAATEEFMTQFYREYTSGTTKAQALRLAQQHVAAQPEWHNAFYWASFQLYGQW